MKEVTKLFYSFLFMNYRTWDSSPDLDKQKKQKKKKKKEEKKERVQLWQSPSAHFYNNFLLS